MQQTVFAVVAQAVNYRDHDRILTLVTRERGTVTATARGCRKPQSKLMSCAQPFVYGEYELAEAKGRWYVKSCQVREIFYNLRMDPMILTAAGQAVRAAREFANPEEENAKLFTLLLLTLARLCEAKADPVAVLAFYLAKLLAFAGFCPETEACVCCGAEEALDWFDGESGGAVCRHCAKHLPTAKPLSSACRRMLGRMAQAPSAGYPALLSQLLPVAEEAYAHLLRSYAATAAKPLPHLHTLMPSATAQKGSLV